MRSTRDAHPQVHGTADPDTQPPERFADRIDPAALAEFNAGVRRARRGSDPSRYVTPTPETCRWCKRATSGRCRHHREAA